jgi:hypothetical protein
MTDKLLNTRTEYEWNPSNRSGAIEESTGKIRVFTITAISHRVWESKTFSAGNEGHCRVVALLLRQRDVPASNLN